jgi:hypothetical protein
MNEIFATVLSTYISITCHSRVIGAFFAAMGYRIFSVQTDFIKAVVHKNVKSPRLVALSPPNPPFASPSLDRPVPSSGTGGIIVQSTQSSFFNVFSNFSTVIQSSSSAAAASSSTVAPALGGLALQKVTSKLTRSPTDRISGMPETPHLLPATTGSNSASLPPTSRGRP